VGFGVSGRGGGRGGGIISVKVMISCCWRHTISYKKSPSLLVSFICVVVFDAQKSKRLQGYLEGEVVWAPKGEKGGKRKKKRTESHSIYIYKVLKQEIGEGGCLEGEVAWRVLDTFVKLAPDH